METIITYKKPRKSLPTPQKVVSFKAFETKEKSKIQSAYPFLSPEQIKGKIKDRWNKLTDAEKQKYTIYKLEPTPTKKKGKKDKKATKRKTQSFPDFFSPKPKAAKHDPEVCDMPEYVNTQKLSDFRSSHTEIYNNDFSDDLDMVKGSPESSLFPGSSVNTYKPSGNVGTRLKTLDCKKAETHGILKNSDLAEKEWNKAKVSFSSLCKVKTYRNDRDSDQDEGNDEMDNYSYVDDSDDEESFLIHREDTEFGVADSENVTDSQNKHDDKRVEEKQNGERPRSDQDKVTDEKNIDIIGEFDPRSDKPDSIKLKDAVNSKRSGLRKRKVETDASNNELFKSPLPNPLKKTKGSSKKKTTTNTGLRQQTPDMGKIKDQTSLQVTPLMSDKSENPDDYTTPQMDESLQQQTLDQVVKAPQKSRQSRQSIDARERVQAQLVTRQVNRFLLAEGKTEAPQKEAPQKSRKSRWSIDAREKVQGELVTKKAGCKAEGKKGKESGSGNTNKIKNKEIKSNKDKIKNTAETYIKCNIALDKTSKSNESDSSDSRTEVSHSAQRTRRSNRIKNQSPRDKTGVDIDNHPDNTNESLTSGSHEFTDLNNNDVNNDELTVINMNPSGDAGKGISEMAVNPYDFVAAEKDLVRDDQNNVVSSATKTKFPSRRRRQTELIATQSSTSTSSSSSSQESSSSNSNISSPDFDVEEMEASIKKKMVRNNNPVLERALKLLQLTATSSPLNNSPVVSNLDDNEDMDTHSPSLLSPALSGVSELSSASSSLSNSQGSSLPLMPSQSTKEDGLTQLFTDLTPPDQKTQGLYKTQRMLRGSNDKSSVTMTMKEYFSGEADIF